MLVDSLIKGGWLKTPGIIKAFRKIKREDFLTEEMKDAAEIDEAFPIGFGQTISQPKTVAFMLEKLQPGTGDKILDIGYGSGWTTALLAEIAGGKGKVIGVEIVPELAEFGKNNVSKYGFVKKGIVELVSDDGSKGYEKEAPYDRILASASAKEIPLAWKEQLKIGGVIVAPVKNSIWMLKKTGKDEFENREFPGFIFVPLVEE